MCSSDLMVTDVILLAVGGLMVIIGRKMNLCCQKLLADLEMLVLQGLEHLDLPAGWGIWSAVTDLAGGAAAGGMCCKT